MANSTVYPPGAPAGNPYDRAGVMNRGKPKEIAEQDWAVSGLVDCLALNESAVDAILTSDHRDTILSWNKGAERIFGHGQEIVGKPVTEIIPHDYRDRHEQGIHRYLRDRVPHILGETVELEGLHKDGHVFPIELSLSVWENERGLFFGAIIRDISERKRVERLREDVHRLMRHDLKSPLVGIAGFAGLLLKGENLTDKQRKLAQTIQDLGQRMSSLIDRTRDLYAMEDGTFQLDPQPVDLPRLLETVRQGLSPMARHAGVKVVLRRAAEPSLLVPGDWDLLTILFENLLKNAIEAAPPASQVTISWKEAKHEGNPAAQVSVLNRGEIPPEIRPHFFDPYVTRGKKGGVGLGTHSASLIARAHGGEVSFSCARSRQQTRLNVILPLSGVA